MEVSDSDKLKYLIELIELADRHDLAIAVDKNRMTSNAYRAIMNGDLENRWLQQIRAWK